jgi:hypothetical protein
MNKTIISLLLLAMVATASCNTDYAVQGGNDTLTCINTGAKLVEEVTTYLQNKKWFDGPAVGRIVTALKGTWDACSGAFKKSSVSMLQTPVDLAISSSCRIALNDIKSNISTMKSNMRWQKWRTFSNNFQKFKSQVLIAKHKC